MAHRANHHKIFPSGGVGVRTYRYYAPATRGLDLAGMLQDLRAAPLGSIVLLHACAHNPTGVDPSLEQWKVRRARLQLHLCLCCASTASRVVQRTIGPSTTASTLQGTELRTGGM